jgi:hypothetical protein
MFDHYPFIFKQHHVALQTIVRNHAIVPAVSARLLASMYQLALAGLREPVQADGFHTSSLLDGAIKLSSVTEGGSGLWLQLALVDGKPQPYLTAGQKWVMENPVPAHGNISTTIW